MYALMLMGLGVVSTTLPFTPSLSSHEQAPQLFQTGYPAPITPTVPSGPPTIRINAGGPTHTVGGVSWSGCTAITACSGYVSGGFAYSEADPISGVVPPADQMIYQSEWTGGCCGPNKVPVGQIAFTFNVPVVNGDYTVRLHFAELNKGGEELRLFDVNLEGAEKELARLDLFATGGIDQALVFDFPVTISDGAVTIDFVHQHENAKVSGIEIIPTTHPFDAYAVTESNVDYIAGLDGSGTAPVEPERIFEPDERLQVTNTRIMPYSAIAHVELVRTDNLSAICTAFLYEKNTLATAAHCLYNKDPRNGPDGHTKNIFVYFGRNGTTDQPFGRCRAQKVLVPTRWVQQGDPDFDWGIIKIFLDSDCRIGAQPSVLRLSSIQPIDYGNVQVAQMSGYSGDKPYGTLWFRQGTLTVSGANRRVPHMLDTVGGDSGAPVYHAIAGCPFCVYAIHQGPTDFTGSINYATQITDDVLRVFTEQAAKPDNVVRYLPLSRK
jgi:V8-like Glu-specific endopeptidase